MSDPTPAQTDTLDQAMTAIARGQAGEAERLLARLVRERPDDPAVHRALALAAMRVGDVPRAVAHLREAIARAPGSGLLQCELGRVLAQSGRFEESLACFERATRLRPDLAEAWYFLGITQARLGRKAPALEALRRADAASPGQVPIMAPLADLEVDAGRIEAAQALWLRLVQLQPREEDVHLKLGESYVHLGQPAKAREVFRAGLALLPGSAGLWMSLGQLLEDAGDRDGAAEAYQAALARRPGWVFPLAALLSLHRSGADEALVARAGQLLAEAGLDDADRALLGFAYGKVIDGRGEHERAMASWHVANAARRRVAGAFDREAFLADVEATLAAFPGPLPADVPRGAPDPRPVLVVGMPRSGTTLVEQILAAHPLVAGSGERAGLSKFAESLPPGPCLDAARVASASADYLAELVRHASRPGAQRLVDKAPMNFLHLGHAAQLVPGARVVWCRRDARDIALSIYGEDFAPGSRFATDLGDIALVIQAQARLMRHWQARLGLPVLEVCYEELVAGLEPMARRLLDFVGLPWDPACLAFHASQREVSTPSRWQVRKPLYTGSVGRWRAHAAALAPVLSLLSPDDPSPALLLG